MVCNRKDHFWAPRVLSAAGEGEWVFRLTKHGAKVLEGSGACQRVVFAVLRFFGPLAEGF